MATWRVIERVGQTLVGVLRQHIRTVFPAVDVRVVSTASFSALGSTAVPTVSLLLYQVGQNPELRNAPPRLNRNGNLVRQSLALELCYLVTAWGTRESDSVDVDEQAAREEHQLLGLILRAFYDRAELGPADLLQNAAGDVWGPLDNLQLALETLPLEDHYRIWDAGEHGYRLSLTYRVRVVGLEGAEEADAPRVVESGLRAGLA